MNNDCCTFLPNLVAAHGQFKIEGDWTQMWERRAWNIFSLLLQLLTVAAVTYYVNIKATPELNFHSLIGL